MAILKMKKLSLITPRDNTRKLIKDLMWLNCVEIIQQKESDISQDVSETKHRLEKIISALDATDKYRQKKGLFSSSEELSREGFEKISEQSEEIYRLIDRVLETQAVKTKLKSAINTLSSRIFQLEPWKNFNLRLDETSTAQCNIICGTLPLNVTSQRLSETEGTEMFYVEEISSDREQKYVCVYVVKKNTQDALKLLSELNFSKVVFPDDDGTASQIISKLKAEIKGHKAAIEKCEQELKTYAQSAYGFELLYDFENSNLNMQNAEDTAFSTVTTDMICGWIPEEKVHKLEKTLKKHLCFWELNDPQENEKPPVELKNNRFASAFEGLIGLYSYPDYHGYDPLKYMSVFYCIIFGMMLADFVYGLLLTIGCLEVIKLIKPKNSMRSFLMMFALSGISTAVFGLLFGSIMGDLPSTFNMVMLGGEAFSSALWFDPTKNPMALLYLSFIIGGIHLLWGMGLNAYMLFKRGKWLDAVFDIFTWYLLFLGIGILAAGAVLSFQAVFNIGVWTVIAGVASLILTQGRAEKSIIMKFLKGVMSLYNIVNYISDMLSYSRILALSLATTVISSVINIMATLAGPSVIGFIMFVLILAVGHALNIALNVLGSFVHASRLQYIEFFGKFYEDGGRHFSPLNVNTKYTKINTEEN